MTTAPPVGGMTTAGLRGLTQMGRVPAAPQVSREADSVAPLFTTTGRPSAQSVSATGRVQTQTSGVAGFSSSRRRQHGPAAERQARAVNDANPGAPATGAVISTRSAVQLCAPSVVHDPAVIEHV